MVTIAVAAILEQLGVDHRRERHRRTHLRLRHDAIADSYEGLPVIAVEKARLTRQSEPLVDDPPGLLVPGQAVPFREHIVAGIAFAHCASASINFNAVSPDIANAVNAGGAGKGGPFSRFCDQLRQPPMFRWMP